jgi:DNA-binding NarL/FixJ family response regulator
VQTPGRTSLLILLILVQSACALFFLSDVVTDGINIDGTFSFSRHLIFEAVATVGLICGIFFEAKYLRDLLRRNQLAEQNIRIASGALSDVIDEYFLNWGLTPSESDVALFAIKGMTNAEIAGLRNSSEGTIKAHLNAVFRKAGVTGRNQLVSILIADLMGSPLLASKVAAR